MRLTRYHWILGGTLLAGLLIFIFCQGAVRLLLLGALCTLSGLCVGLGVSFPQWQMFGRSLCRVRTSRKVVALTFDDGPDPETTPKLLALLAERGVRATFFCVGERVARHPELARRLTAEGHLIGNHSYQHSHGTNVFSVARLRADLARAQEELRRVTGHTPEWFRPPMGLTNPRVFRVAGELRLKVAGYTARGLDKRPATADQIAARILRGLRPGAIILLHDGDVPVERLLAVVTMFIDKIQASGYQCLRLDELLSYEERP
jgi:peptidoglycan/xylan/chitin deacetylase (PgdA/CDA1 family)